MTRRLRLAAFGLVLVAAGCRTCDDRPRLLGRDDARGPDRLAAAPRPGLGCDPCAAGEAMPVGRTMGGFGGEVIYGGITTGLPGGPVLGTPVYPGGPGTVLPGGVSPRRDDELPPPGGYSQPGAVDMGRGGVPKPPTGLTGR